MKTTKLEYESQSPRGNHTCRPKRSLFLKQWLNSKRQTHAARDIHDGTAPCFRGALSTERLLGDVRYIKAERSDAQLKPQIKQRQTHETCINKTACNTPSTAQLSCLCGLSFSLTLLAPLQTKSPFPNPLKTVIESLTLTR